MCPDAQETADLLIFTEEINEKFYLFVQWMFLLLDL